MDHVFMLEHYCYEETDGVRQEQHRLIGVYTERESAELALEQVKNKPGFRENPDGFELTRTALDQTWWTEGFDKYGCNGLY